MAERLTETGMFMGTSVYKIKNGKKSEAVDKLAQLEDIMEKYDIEDLEQLDIILFCLSSETKFQLKQLQKLYKKYKIKNVEELEKELSISRLLHQTIAELSKRVTKVEKDRDAWKKACELACDILMPKSEIKTIQLNDDNQIRNSKEAIDYFYQQAKQFAGR